MTTLCFTAVGRALIATCAVAALVALAGCNEHGVRETLDEKTMVSVIVAEPPLNFFRLRLDGEYERELVSAGVVELIASVERDLYLWVNVWAARPDGTLGTVALGDHVVIDTGASALRLPRVADEHAQLNLSAPPYPVVRGGPGEAYFALSETQLAALGEASQMTLQLGSKRFELWGKQDAALSALMQFAAEAAP